MGRECASAGVSGEGVCQCGSEWGGSIGAGGEGAWEPGNKARHEQN